MMTMLITGMVFVPAMLGIGLAVLGGDQTKMA